MANIKKGQLANIVFPMVDGTDFASIESGITASDFNSAAARQYVGYNHGASATAAFSDLSKTTNLVRSGIFHHVLNETETNFDIVMVRFTHPSCADQLMVFHTVTYDDSDMYSQLSDMGSNLLSYLTGMSGAISDVESQVDLLATSNYLSTVHSDLLSYLAGLSGAVSDVESQVDLLATSNYLSAVHSDLASAIGAVTASVSASDMSDIASRVWATTEGTRVDSRILVIQSLVSDVDSQVNLLATSDYLSQLHSDLRSQVSGITASVSASDMSDIASRVWATTEGTRVDSRILVIQSLVSDVDSQVLLNASVISDVYSLLSDHYSDFQSRVTGTLATSNYLSQVHSDLLSYLAGISGVVSDVDSQLLLNASMISDTYSLLSDHHSDFQSRVAGTLATSNYLSAVHSDLLSYLAGISGAVSDVDSQLVLNASMISDAYSLVSDVDSQVNLLATSNYLSQVHSDLYSAIGGVTASVSASDMSDIASRVWATTEGARVDSRILVIQSMVSDVDSQVNLLATSDYLSQVHSDLYSAIGNVSVTLTASDISDIASAVLAGGIEISASDMSDIASRVWATTEGARVDSRILVIQSMVSDVDSQLLLTASLVSDAYSLLSDHHSDFQSRVTGTLATSAQLSDVQSDLLSYLAGMSGMLSDVDSQLLLNASMISDTYSLLSDHHSDFQSRVTGPVATSDYLSQLHSDLGSQIGGITAGVSASDISDIASAVWADTIGARVDSRIVLLQSSVSDVESQVDLLATSDYLSQLHSDLYSAIGGVSASIGASDISDIASAVWADTIGARVDSRILVLQSNLSDVESQVDLLATSDYLSQLHSDLYSAIGNVSVTLTASDVSDIASAVAAAGLSISASDMSDISSRVWSFGTRTLTQSAASVTAAVSGSDITLKRGDSFSASLTGLGDISGRSKLWFTVKSDKADADAAALIQIEETAGLIYLNGSDASARAANGDITVDDAAAGDITITLDEVETDDLSIQDNLSYDVQMLTSAGAVTTLTEGDLEVSADVTRAVT